MAKHSASGKLHSTADEEQGRINALIGSGITPTYIDLPEFYATYVQVDGEKNNFCIVFNRNKSVEIRDGNESLHASVQTPVAQVDMSAETAKDLVLILLGQLAAIEKEFGPIETPFTRSQTRRDPSTIKAN